MIVRAVIALLCGVALAACTRHAGPPAICDADDLSLMSCVDNLSRFEGGPSDALREELIRMGFSVARRDDGDPPTWEASYVWGAGSECRPFAYVSWMEDDAGRVTFWEQRVGGGCF